MLNKIRKVLGVITDLLLVGRSKGWWSKKEVPFPKDKKRVK